MSHMGVYVIEPADVEFKEQCSGRAERRHSGSVLTKLNTMPALSSVNASRLTLRTAVHDSSPAWGLTLHRAELSSANNAPVYPGPQENYYEKLRNKNRKSIGTRGERPCRASPRTVRFFFQKQAGAQI